MEHEYKILLIKFRALVSLLKKRLVNKDVRSWYKSPFHKKRTESSPISSVRMIEA